MLRTLTLTILGLSLALTGCSTMVVEPTHQIYGEPEMVTLTEISKTLGLRIVEGDYWGDRYLYTPSGDTILIRKDAEQYWFNTIPRKIEYPGVKYSPMTREFSLPLGAYDSICIDLGRLDMCRDTIPAFKPTERTPISAKPPVTTAVATPAKSPLVGMTILIDAGHGGKDPGGIGNGIQEKGVVLNVSRKVEALAKALGAKVIMTRHGDTYPELSERAGLANARKADFFLSIHANISADKGTTGVETYFQAKGTRGLASKRLATAINTNLAATTGADDRNARSDKRGLHVLKHTKMPAALVEIGFLSNSGEARKLNSRAYQSRIAAGILKGLVEYASQTTDATAIVLKD